MVDVYQVLCADGGSAESAREKDESVCSMYRFRKGPTMISHKF